MVLAFQFHKGTIRTSEGTKLMQSINANDTNFNSIKVRLEPWPLTCSPADFQQFQFNKGTIRTLRKVGAILANTRFQFHKGTIRTVLKGAHAMDAFTLKRSLVFQF